MSRRRSPVKRKPLPDPQYGSERVSKFVNVIMTRGKKSVAERIVYGAMREISEKTGNDPCKFWKMQLTKSAQCGG